MKELCFHYFCNSRILRSSNGIDSLIGSWLAQEWLSEAVVSLTYTLYSINEDTKLLPFPWKTYLLLPWITKWQKAFDSVSHSILLTKLQSVGISGIYYTGLNHTLASVSNLCALAQPNLISCLCCQVSCRAVSLDLCYSLSLSMIFPPWSMMSPIC